MRMRQIENVGTVRRAPARLARIGKERDRRLRTDQNQLFDIGQRLDHLFGEIGDALDHDPARAALETRREGVAHDACAGSGSDATGSDQALFLQSRAAHKDRRLPAVLQRLRGGVDSRGGDSRRRGQGQLRCRMLGFEPCGVGRQDQCRDLAGRLHCGMDRTRAICGDGLRAGR